MANTYFTDRVVQYPGRVTMTPTGNTNEYDLARAEGNVTEQGTPFNADTFNSIANQILSDATDAAVAEAVPEAVAQAVPDAVAQALQAVGKYVTETGTSNGWTYEKYSDGTMRATQQTSIGPTWNSIASGFYAAQKDLTAPSGMTFRAGFASPTVKSVYLTSVQVQGSGSTVTVTAHRLSGASQTFTYVVYIEGTYSQ